MRVRSDIPNSIFPYPGVTYHIVCYMEGMEYLSLDTNSTESITLPSMVLFY